MHDTVTTKEALEWALSLLFKILTKIILKVKRDWKKKMRMMRDFFLNVVSKSSTYNLVVLLMVINTSCILKLSISGFNKQFNTVFFNLALYI